MKWLLHSATGNLVLLVGVCAAGATALGLMIRRRVG
jgi:hypothetical protein